VRGGSLGRAAPLIAVCLALGVGCTRSPSVPQTGSGEVPLATGSPPRACPVPAIPPGTYEKTITPRDGLVPFAVGRWVMVTTDVADPNCYYPLAFILYLHDRIVFTDSHPYTVEGNRIVLHANNEPNAHYRVLKRGSSVVFSGGLDDSYVRRSILLVHPYRKIA
jgi:hypothetical protein